MRFRLLSASSRRRDGRPDDLLRARRAGRELRRVVVMRDGRSVAEIAGQDSRKRESCTSWPRRAPDGRGVGTVPVASLVGEWSVRTEIRSSAGAHRPGTWVTCCSRRTLRAGPIVEPCGAGDDYRACRDGFDAGDRRRWHRPFRGVGDGGGRCHSGGVDAPWSSGCDGGFFDRGRGDWSRSTA